MKAQALVVDDSAFMRKLISEMIEESRVATVAGTARNGRDALEKIALLQPDIVTMDIEMPELDGLEALKIIGERFDVPVIILSSHSAKGSQITIDALQMGAVDFVQKSAFGDQNGLARVREELREKLQAILGTTETSQPAPPTVRPPDQRFRKGPQAPVGPLDAVVIGTSTGGPKTLMQLIGGIRRKPSVPLFVVQHMPREFTRSLAQRLDNHAICRVVEASEGQNVVPGTIYLAPGDYHMEVVSGTIRLNQEPKLHGVRPAADVLFRSAAAAYGSRVLALILTGMGSDGTPGLREIKSRGGRVIAQDRATSVIYGMPGSAVAAGVVDEEMSLDGIIEELNRIL